MAVRAGSPSPDFKRLIRDIPDFPKKGVIFKDITPVLKDARGYARAVDALASHYKGKGITHVVSIEARGFLLGAAVAYALGAGLVPVRKKGKLPHATFREDYQLEYGTDVLEIHRDALGAKDRAIIVDDVLATGGTVEAVVKLTEACGARVAGLGFFVELTFLKGREKLKNHPVFSAVRY